MKKLAGMLAALGAVVFFWRRRQTPEPTTAERVRETSVNLAATGKSRASRILGWLTGRIRARRNG